MSSDGSNWFNRWFWYNGGTNIGGTGSGRTQYDPSSLIWFLINHWLWINERIKALGLDLFYFIYIESQIEFENQLGLWWVSYL